MARKNETEGTKLMLALISLLGTQRPDPELSPSATADHGAPPVPLTDIAGVMGIDVEQARGLVERLATMGAGSEDSAGAFNMYIDDNDAVVVNTSYDKVRSSLRLNPAEARALDTALDLAGIPEDDSLRRKLLAAAVVPTIDRDELQRVFTAVDRGAGSEVTTALLAAIDLHHWVSFTYRKTSNGEVTQQEVEPYSVAYDHASWYLDGYSRSAAALRTYRLDAMANVVDEGPCEEHQGQSAPVSAGPYDLAGLPLAMLEIDADDLAGDRIDWPGLEVVNVNGGAPTTKNGRVRVTIPCRDDPSWLARQIVARAGRITVIDPPQLADAVSDLARAELAQARYVWQQEGLGPSIA